MQAYSPLPASEEAMTAFHEPDYISFLRHVTPDNQVRRRPVTLLQPAFWHAESTCSCPRYVPLPCYLRCMEGCSQGVVEKEYIRVGFNSSMLIPPANSSGHEHTAAAPPQTGSAAQEYFSEQLARCNVGEDCPVFDGLYNFCSKYAGGSIGGAVMLNWARNDIVINWAGGLHHGKRSEASMLLASTPL